MTGRKTFNDMVSASRSSRVTNMAKKDCLIVRIDADQPVTYSLDNGRTKREFEPGEYYEVPVFAAQGMIARGWAHALTADTVPLQSRTQQSDPSTTPAAQQAPESPAVAGEPSSIEQARTALADLLGRLKQAGKRPSRRQANQWCCNHGHELPEIRFKIQVWPNACDLVGVPEWKQGGRIPRKETITDSEIEEL